MGRWGVRSQTSKVKRQRSKVKRQTSKVKGQRSNVKGQTSKVKRQRSNVKGQRSNVKGQRSKVKGQRSKVKREELLLFPFPPLSHSLSPPLLVKNADTIAVHLKEVAGRFARILEDLVATKQISRLYPLLTTRIILLIALCVYLY